MSSAAGRARIAAAARASWADPAARAARVAALAAASRAAWADPASRSAHVAAMRAAFATPDARARRRAASLAGEERRRALRAWVARMESELFPPGEVFTGRARRVLVRVLGEFFDATVDATRASPAPPTVARPRVARSTNV